MSGVDCLVACCEASCGLCCTESIRLCGYPGGLCGLIPDRWLSRFRCKCCEDEAFDVDNEFASHEAEMFQPGAGNTHSQAESENTDVHSQPQPRRSMMSPRHSALHQNLFGPESPESVSEKKANAPS